MYHLIAIYTHRVSKFRFPLPEALGWILPIGGVAELLTKAQVPTNPLPLGQSFLIVWPQLVGLIALTSICFAVSYIIFMRREIRAT